MSNTYESALHLPVLLERVWDNLTPGAAAKSATSHVDRLTLPARQAAAGPYDDTNKGYAAGTKPQQEIEAQRFGANVETGYQLTTTMPEADELRYGASAITWALGLQQSDGSFKDCKDSEHSTGLFLRAFGETAITAQSRGDGRATVWKNAFLAGAAWYFQPENLARIDLTKTHRPAYTAQIAFMAERLQPGGGWLAKGLPYLRAALYAQDPSGYFPEQGDAHVKGYDVSYNCITLSSLARVYLLGCDLGVTDAAIAQTRAALALGLDWQKSRMFAPGHLDPQNGVWNVTGSTRIPYELDRNGNPKHMDQREADFALLLGACATGRAGDYDAGIVAMRGQRSSPWLQPADSYAFGFASPDPPGGTVTAGSTTGACGMTAAITASGAVDNEDGTFSVSFTCTPTGGTSPYSYLWAFALPAGLDGMDITPLLPVSATSQTVNCYNIPFAPYQAVGLAQRVGVPSPVWLIPSCTVTDGG